jgi:small-conductance mechanosensitive channel
VVQSKVLAEPAPLVLCTGLGDCAVHFELRVWTARFEAADLVRSQLAVAVHRALAAANIEIPFHQYRTASISVTAFPGYRRE